MKTLTGIEQIRVRNQVIKTQIIEACNINEDIYNNYLFEAGISWISDKCYQDEAVIAIISQEPWFWKWFMNHWFTRENDFLATYTLMVLSPTAQSKELMYNLWLDLHKSYRINVYPSGIEWDAILKKLYI
jgi:hypothetical protein